MCSPSRVEAYLDSDTTTSAVRSILKLCSLRWIITSKTSEPSVSVAPVGMYSLWRPALSSPRRPWPASLAAAKSCLPSYLLRGTTIKGWLQHLLLLPLLVQAPCSLPHFQMLLPPLLLLGSHLVPHQLCLEHLVVQLWDLD